MKPWEQAKKEQEEAAASKPALPPWEQARADRGQDQYRGSVLPFSVGPDGKPHFDSDAGVLGSLKRGLSIGRDALEGKLDFDRGPKHILEPDPTIERVTEAAGMALPTNPAVRAGDRAIPGVAGRPTQQQRIAPPSADELHGTAVGQYDAVRNAGVDYKSSSVADLAKGLKQQLEQDGILNVPEGAPSTHQVIDMLASPPGGSVAPIQNLEAARRAFAGIAQNSKNGTERGAAQRAVQSITEFIERADPQSVVAGPAAEAGRTIGQARGNFAASARSDTLTGVERNADLRAAAANSGQNSGNAIRSRLASLLVNNEGRGLRGFNDAEMAGVEGVVNGSVAANATRKAGNILGGGGGMATAVVGGLGAAGGAAAGGYGGAALGAAALPILGAGLKGGSNALTRRALRNVDRQVRSRSPLMNERQSQAPYSQRPMHTQQAILRAMLLAEQGDK